MLLGLLAAQAAAVAPAPSPYEVATAHRRAGRTIDAVAQYRAALRAEPDNVDALVGLGLSLSALGDNVEAEHALNRAIVLAPGYWDAHVGLARLAYAGGDAGKARERLAPVLAGDPHHRDALAFLKQLNESARSRPTRRLDPWAGRSRLSAGLPSWSEAGAVLTLPVSAGWSASATVEATRRFERNDVYLEGGLSRTLRNRGTWRLAVGGAPEADHRPELSVRGGGARPFGSVAALEAVLDGGWSRYRNVEVVSFSPGLRFAVNDRLSLEGRWVAADPSDGDLLSGYAVRADVAATPDSRLVLSWADAPESSEGRPVTVETLSLGGSHDLSDQLTLSLTAIHEDRDSFTRDEVMLGAAVRF